ncbi:hypothetical protein PYCC9005_002247 [Savitreella phatthalungensis]
MVNEKVAPLLREFDSADGYEGEKYGIHHDASEHEVQTIGSRSLRLMIRRQGHRLLGLIMFLVPSFATDMLARRSAGGRAKEHGSKLLSLDGLRGLCCLAVINMHWNFAIVDTNSLGNASVNVMYFWHRPFWYLAWAGTSHVYIFFVMSGYVLSVKCLRNIHEGISTGSVISSAVFRRAIRIFLPPIILLICYMFALQVGMFNSVVAFFKSERLKPITAIRMFEDPPPIGSTFSDQFWHVLGAIGRLIDPNMQHNLPDFKEYDSHLWTITVEYYGSIALYVVLTATCHLRTSFRLTCHVLLVFYCWIASHQYYTLFFAGMTIAEFDILFKNRHSTKNSHSSRGPLPSIGVAQAVEDDDIPWSQRSAEERVQRFVQDYLNSLNLLLAVSTTIGLFFLSLPLVWPEDTPPFKQLLVYFPDVMYLGQKVDAMRALGAILVVWPVTFLAMNYNPKSNPVTTTILANPVSAYLGKISFALYLVHGFTIRWLGYTILPSIYHLVIRTPERRAALIPTVVLDPTGTKVIKTTPAVSALTATELGTIWVLGYAIVLPATVILADLFWRAVDVKCVSLGQWIERRMVAPPSAPHKPSHTTPSTPNLSSTSTTVLPA